MAYSSAVHHDLLTDCQVTDTELTLTPQESGLKIQDTAEVSFHANEWVTQT